MKKPDLLKFCFIGVVATAGFVGSRWLGAAQVPESVEQNRAPRIFPDYCGVVIPPNIAPLNFKVEEPGTRYRVELRSSRGDPLTISSRDGSIRIPAKRWRSLLRANAGEPLLCEVRIETASGQWARFAPMTNLIAPEKIDSCLTYRRLRPQYDHYSVLGVYQRDLESFEEQPLLENSDFNHGCLNCHTCLNHRPDTFVLLVRSSDMRTKSILLARSNQLERVDKPISFLSWHPSGRLIAFSTNKFSILCHTLNTKETRDVYDARSALGIYRIDSNCIVMPPAIAKPDRNETWPAWSADGRYLYFSSAPVASYQQILDIHYDLMRASYDIEHDQWGEPETVISAGQAGGSLCQPKVSPDGRFVLFSLCRYGMFPTYQAGSCLCALDLARGRWRRLESGNFLFDSYHSWSSNSRWIVVTSKRVDGLFGRPFIGYMDEDGGFHKPFLLPQEDPSYYETCLHSFNVPELVDGAIRFKESDFIKALGSLGKAAPPAATSPASYQEH
jgi:hypothetical protein